MEIFQTAFQWKCALNLQAAWILALLFLLQMIGQHYAQSSDSCNANLELDLAFDTIECVNVGNDYILRYEQNDNAISIVLSAPYTTGWVGMAFSEDEFMVGSSAMVGWIKQDGSGSIKQYYLGGKSVGKVQVDDTKLVVVNNSASVQSRGSTIYLAFQLLFAEPVKSQNLLYASGSVTPSNDQLSKHSSAFHTTLDFTTGTSSTSSTTETMKRNHGALNIFAWGVLLPIGAIIARYFRQWDPAWFYLHVGIQLFGFIFGVAGVILGVALYNRLDSNIRAHRGLGIFILVLGILQVLALLLRPQKEAKVRKYWNWYHQWFGRLALFLAAVNIVYGIRVAEAGQTWKVGYGFVLAILLLVVIVLESIFWIKWFRRPPEAPAFQMYNTNA
ncbi:hypothetical protein SUGI_0295100 [Cryptomeria japonica]|uniref:cytochrome b561 and DOMON domain-containing protein At3g61750 n=1 Tax=Cryptomeria japonica TaxID=3369 RepID=UPI002408DC26|nr:cytochrome b561 and DOMON domain-containing protein At3g61750 [Cryptomeria japonica]GLJ17056.1 hypothetical protein SUGI_0295100 [Cryptomeria japonica]